MDLIDPLRRNSVIVRNAAEFPGEIEVVVGTWIYAVHVMGVVREAHSVVVAIDAPQVPFPSVILYISIVAVDRCVVVVGGREVHLDELDITPRRLGQVSYRERKYGNTYVLNTALALAANSAPSVAQILRVLVEGGVKHLITRRLGIPIEELPTIIVRYDWRSWSSDSLRPTAMFGGSSRHAIEVEATVRCASQ